jgi:hypothetical protein
VQCNKRTLFHSEGLRSKKPRQLPSTNTLQTKNMFDALSDSQEMNEVVISDKKEVKPPPIFIPNISNIKQMITSVESVIPKTEYTYKCLAGNKVKICPLSIDSYRQLVRKLNDEKISFHTFQVKQDRAFKVVLKNMHSSTDANDIKVAIEEKGHKVRNVANIRDFKTKLPLSMFYVDLEPSQNNKDIYQIQYLMNAKIVFEPPRRRPDVVQCKKCQEYGHTKSYCWYPFRCVKCGQNHDTAMCKKSKSDPPKCALCEGSHPANYKGCAIYREIKNKLYPPMRQRSLEQRKSTSETIPAVISSRPPAPSTTVNPTPTSSNTISGRRSYAQAAATSRDANPKSNEISNTNTLEQTINSFVDKFERLLMQQSQQIGALMNLLTTVISKLK